MPVTVLFALLTRIIIRLCVITVGTVVAKISIELIVKYVLKRSMKNGRTTIGCENRSGKIEANVYERPKTSDFQTSANWRRRNWKNVSRWNRTKAGAYRFLRSRWHKMSTRLDSER